MCRRNLAQVVDFELVAFQVPIAVGRDARRVARIGHLVAVRSREADFARRTAAAHVGDKKPRRFEETELGVARVAKLRARDPVEIAADHHIALGPDFVVDDVVVEPVGKNGFVARTKLDAAFGGDAILVAVDSICAQEQNAARRLFGRQRRGWSRLPRPCQP